MINMTSNRPYLVRALYEWLVDNNQTPYLLVDTTNNQVVVPRQFVQDGYIVLNIGPNAVHNLQMGNNLIFFSARFSGQSMEVRVPPSAVLGIYSHENGLGMMFPKDVVESDVVEDQEKSAENSAPMVPISGKVKPRLTIVK